MFGKIVTEANGGLLVWPRGRRQRSTISALHCSIIEYSMFPRKRDGLAPARFALRSKAGGKAEFWMKKITFNSLVECFVSERPYMLIGISVFFLIHWFPEAQNSCSRNEVARTSSFW